MKIDFIALEREYFGYTDEDTDELRRIKTKIQRRLNEAERRIFAVYLETGTYAAAGRIFKVSGNTIRKKIKVIKCKLY